jgi:glycosyltransferase involved in cell wall biosynthesis
LIIFGTGFTTSLVSSQAFNPKVSIICPFLDGARYLEEAIESVLAQTYDDFELLLIDDGSTDGSSGIAQSYSERFPSRIRYLEHPGHVNRGTSPSRNLGLRTAEGELIAMIDCDDVWVPEKLLEQVAFMNDHPEVGMLCGAMNYWSSWAGGEDRLVLTGGRAGELLAPPHALLELYPLGVADAPGTSDVMFRRSLIDQGCIFEESLSGSVQMFEDQTFFASVYLTAPVYFSDRVWCRYRQHPESCVAVVSTGGHYATMRRDFLEWLGNLVINREVPNKDKILSAIARAQWEIGHPSVGGLLRRLRRTAWLLQSRRGNYGAAPTMVSK